MGELVDGVWHKQPVAKGTGAFERKASSFRNWITPDGAPGPSGTGGFAAQSGRYHLYISYACPWAHRAMLLRGLRGLAAHISFDVVHPFMGDLGWHFGTDFDGATGDSLYGAASLSEIYVRAESKATTRVTVPVLWDKQTEQIVSNESAEIILMLDQAFNGLTGNTETIRPKGMGDALNAVNARIYDTLNNGVYRAGFAGNQDAYSSAVDEVFATLEWLEARLAKTRYVMGEVLTEADWRLLPTLLRFDPVYVGHFKCDRARLMDYPSLWGYTRELYGTEAVQTTTRFDHIRYHYYTSHETLNPKRIVSTGPAIDWHAPHGRGG
ncbi:MAG: glutathione S-transferase family protein [Pseudomonadota bacterium]